MNRNHYRGFFPLAFVSVFLNKGRGAQQAIQRMVEMELRTPAAK